LKGGGVNLNVHALGVEKIRRRGGRTLRVENNWENYGLQEKDL